MSSKRSARTAQEGERRGGGCEVALPGSGLLAPPPYKGVK